MNRRRILRLAIGVGVGVAARASPLWAQSSAAGLCRVGVLAPSTRVKEEITLKPFFDQMRNSVGSRGGTLRTTASTRTIVTRTYPGSQPSS
jgi:hypothetical protein